jgi:hypothetical protein
MTSHSQIHPLGRPLGPVDQNCAGCGWATLRGPGPRVLRCVAAGGSVLPRVDPAQQCCDRWESEPDCLSCTACCGPAYDVVELSPRDPVRRTHPELVEKVGGRYRIQRAATGNCAALRPTGECAIYDARPSCCRLFEKLGPNCIHARRRAGLSPPWSGGS